MLEKLGEILVFILVMALAVGIVQFSARAIPNTVEKEEEENSSNNEEEKNN